MVVQGFRGFLRVCPAARSHSMQPHSPTCPAEHCGFLRVTALAFSIERQTPRLLSVSLRHWLATQNRDLIGSLLSCCLTFGDVTPHPKLMCSNFRLHLLSLSRAVSVFESHWCAGLRWETRTKTSRANHPRSARMLGCCSSFNRFRLTSGPHQRARKGLLHDTNVAVQGRPRRSSDSHRKPAFASSLRYPLFAPQGWDTASQSADALDKRLLHWVLWAKSGVTVHPSTKTHTSFRLQFPKPTVWPDPSKFRCDAA